MLADKIPLYQREMLVMEEKLHQICVGNYITDNYLDFPNPAYCNFLLSTVPVIENLAKDLHQELATQFPNLAAFEEKEKFDYDSLKFLDNALNLAPKQIQIASNLVVLSSANRTLYPLLNAYSKDQGERPNWILSYQSFKHEYSSVYQSTTQSMSENNSFNVPDIIYSRIPTARTVLETASAYFLLFCVAKSLPLEEHIPYGDFDPKFGSKIFTATFTRPLFSSFTVTLDNSNLQKVTKWQESLFIVKDPDDYIIALHNKFTTGFNQIKQEMLETPDFLAFCAKLPDTQNSNSFEYLAYKYGEATGNTQWYSRITSLSSQLYSAYLSNWMGQDIAFMRANKSEPVVVLNTYKENDPIYDYYKINNS